MKVYRLKNNNGFVRKDILTSQKVKLQLHNFIKTGKKECSKIIVENNIPITWQVIEYNLDDMTKIEMSARDFYEKGKQVCENEKVKEMLLSHDFELRKLGAKMCKKKK